MPDLAKMYNDTFGFDFSKMTPDQLKQADSALLKARQAQFPVVSPNGGIMLHPERERIIKNGGLSTSQAQLLSVYAAYRAGIKPPEVDEARFQKHGIPQDQIELHKKEVFDEWKSRQANQFSDYINPELDKKKPNTDKTPVPSTETPRPAAAVAPPPPIAAPATPGAEGAPLPPPPLGDAGAAPLPPAMPPTSYQDVGPPPPEAPMVQNDMPWRKNHAIAMGEK